MTDRPRGLFLACELFDCAFPKTSKDFEGLVREFIRWNTPFPVQKWESRPYLSNPTPILLPSRVSDPDDVREEWWTERVPPLEIGKPTGWKDWRYGYEEPNQRCSVSVDYGREGFVWRGTTRPNVLPFGILGVELYSGIGFTILNLADLQADADYGLDSTAQVNTFMLDLLQAARRLYQRCSPAYGYVGEALAPANPIRDFREIHLNKLSWANFFGPAFVAKYGKDFLLNAPGHTVDELPDGGVFYQLTEDFIVDDSEPVRRRVIEYFKKSGSVKQLKVRLVTPSMIPRPPRQRRGKPGTSEVAITPRNLGMLASHAARYPLQEMSGSPLDYSPQSLRTAESVLLAKKGLEAAKMNTLVTIFGAYLGEVIIRNLGGRWRGGAGVEDIAVVSLPGIAEVRPVVRVMRFVESGGEDSIEGWYRYIESEVHRSSEES